MTPPSVDAQEASSTPPDLQAQPPRSWVVDLAANEVRAIQHNSSFLRYRMHTVDSKGDHVRDIVETRESTVARLILLDGKKLTPQQDADERSRLKDMLQSPSLYAKHVRRDAEGKKLASDLIQLMPDAMLYTYTPGQPHAPNARGTPQVVIDYAPNPAWNPPTTTAQALTGLRGRMWIDARNRTLLRMEGEVFKGVNFGWGMLAHIYPGGHLVLEQTNVGDRSFFTHFEQHVKVRALLLKTINVDSVVDASNFQPLPSALTYQQAVQVLLDTPLPDR